MVQPPPPMTAATRPDGPVPVPLNRQLTSGNHEAFSTNLRKLLARGDSFEAAPRTAESALSTVVAGKREMSFQPEPSGCLAPDEQPSLGGGVNDVAELFALINPMGGNEAPIAAAPAAPTPHSGVAEVAELVERWVRRVALGGDQRRAAVRLDIGQGRFSGAELLVVAEAGHVSVELQLPSAMSSGDLSARLRARLERRGYAADVSVR